MDRLNRRTLIATVGAVSAGVAGCISQGPGAEDDDAGNQTTDDATNESDDDTDDPPAEDEGDEEQEEEAETGYSPAIDHGELVDDFIDLTWEGRGGSRIFLDEEDAVAGEAALRVEQDDASFATAGFAFPEGIDMTDRLLSMAVKVDVPGAARIETRFRAPSSDDRLVSTRRLPAAMDGWMRVDFGISRGRGDPDVTDVQALRVEVKSSEEGDIRFWIDDVRLTELLGESHAILAFYGGYESTYETVLPRLEERGMVGAIPLAPGAIGAGGRMSLDELREVRDAGWDVCSFPIRSDNLPQMSADDQRRVIEEDQATLAGRGFEDGARHFFAPRHSINADTLDVLDEAHETGFLFGGNSAGMPPTAPLTIPTINGYDLDSSEAAILRADRHDGLVVLGFGRIGEDGMSVDELEAQLDRIESNEYAGGLNVITPSELVDEHL